MINFKTIIRIIGILLLLETTMFLVCSGVSFYYRESDMLDFWKAGGITAGVGLLLAFLGKGGERQLTRRDGYVLVSFAWVAFSLFGMLPFYIGGYIPDITNAFFETMSGFSSTGATILNNIESLPHGILFWRSMTQWIGGLGIIMFTIAVLPIFGISGLQVFAAEASGPTHDKVHPRIGITAKWIWSIYAGITALLVGLLMLGGMDWFDSICHAFATTGTGGFSTKQASVAHYNSPYIEYVISIFMFISGINFTLLLLFVNRKFKKFISNAELKFYFGSVVLFTAIIALVLYYTSCMGMEESFRKSLFQVISLQTSTGFATDDYMKWTPVLWGLFTIIMLMGACAGSTTGGLKCIRMVILTKVSRNEFKHILHPNAVLPIRINKQVIPPSIVSTVLAFCFIYLIIIIVSTLLMMAMGVGTAESLGCVISSIGNMGPGLGETGPAYSWNALPDAAKWLLSFLMLLGRLELFTVLLLFTPDFWKRN
ncbi:TrkH family potassium uptake protein [Bacteroides sp. AF34-31BH]|uniref:TrkH family potassium uptake protein n=1 Tax=Bacteroides sp. AF34-31BH TaxID=2292931 RepID=UPI000E72AA8B|nr:TrkH family potassium uptake protein [Bacteroides sp. AF34-31BH]RJV03850.1 TrkH family potassium uptake protein [Bacteroides sp. AF34-31BH]